MSSLPGRPLRPALRETDIFRSARPAPSAVAAALRSAPLLSAALGVDPGTVAAGDLGGKVAFKGVEGVPGQHVGDGDGDGAGGAGGAPTATIAGAAVGAAAALGLAAALLGHRRGRARRAASGRGLFRRGGGSSGLPRSAAPSVGWLLDSPGAGTSPLGDAGDARAIALSVLNPLGPGVNPP